MEQAGGKRSKREYSFFEAERLKARADKRQKRKAKEALDIKVKQNPASAALSMSDVW